MRSVALEWTTPANLPVLRRLGFSQASVGVTARNPWVSRTYAGFEADAGSGSASLQDLRVKRLVYPTYRTLAATITLSY